MKVEQAYNLDSEEIVDAELAYDYYWSGIIKNKKNFECPAENCAVQITCANLDKTRQDMKVDPYFKAVGEHEPDCNLIKEILKNDLSSNSGIGGRKSRAKKQDELPDVFGLSRPKSHLEKKQKFSTGITPVTCKENKRKSKSETNISNFQSSTYYAVRAFVSKYLRYKSLSLLGQRYVNIKGYNVSYKEMFVDISGQNLNNISKYPRVYFGKAVIVKRKENDYAVSFEASLSHNEELISPSIYIAESLINGAFTKKLSEEKFKILSQKNHLGSWVFVYGIPKVKLVKGNSYININISNLDYLDLREKI
ncbi:hypothetical protein [Colwellia sp. Bg11-12]|uniref:hypothetical protein n=1 Tax=Colwellia sp. Bg11-12 TaxID=2759817 RepID=UPI0015F5CD0A|nr:hypothetical protein [Colwellia sp. Bg11-12]MBA6263908.1 hypothetical protein [Colwellia sp. Bg11-12]